MPIPINPSSIIGARPYTVPQVATPLSICKAPAEGAKFVPMQFAFSQTATWFVDMAGGNAQGAVLSQVACLFVDASASTHDVNILFPDSGYQVRVGQGDGQLIPVLTAGLTPPKFYVILDSSGAVNATDIVNIFAINQFIPEFVTANTSSFQNVLAYGYGALFQPQPSFTQSQTFVNTWGNGSDANPVTLINAAQWYITAIQLSGSCQTSGGIVSMICRIIDGTMSTPIFNLGFASSVTTESVPPLIVNGLNIISSGTGALKVQLIGANQLTGTNQSFVFINVAGGILVP